VPASWDGFVVRWRHGRSLYEITVENPGHRNRGVAEVLLDGLVVDAGAIPLTDDGAVHHLRVVMGAPAPPAPADGRRVRGSEPGHGAAAPEAGGRARTSP
jgi:hypothetical protein